MKSINLLPGNERATQMVVCSDGFEIYAYQFSLKQGMCVSHDFPRKLDSPKDLINYLPEDYDKRLGNHLEFRLKRPVLGLSSVQCGNEVALFEMQQNGDLFYECFEVDKSGEADLESGGNKARLYRRWLGKFVSC